LVARSHRVGLDHADLNAHNLLFDPAGKGWVIDLDRGELRIPATGWRERNLARLHRSLLKVRGERPVTDVERDFARLRQAYDHVWARGY
jgi:3-deoxy-D-manno-octulosonic acid kinase